MGRLATSRARRVPRSERDAVIKEALHRESLEVVGGQLKLERDERKRIQGGDAFVSFAILGTAIALGLTLARGRIF
jgi:hypothetical protein